MKKLMAVVLSMALLVGMASCSKGSDEDRRDSRDAEAEAAEDAEDAAEKDSDIAEESGNNGDVDGDEFSEDSENQDSEEGGVGEEFCTINADSVYVNPDEISFSIAGYKCTLGETTFEEALDAGVLGYTSTDGEFYRDQSSELCGYVFFDEDGETLLGGYLEAPGYGNTERNIGEFASSPYNYAKVSLYFSTPDGSPVNYKDTVLVGISYRDGNKDVTLNFDAESEFDEGYDFGFNRSVSYEDLKADIGEPSYESEFIALGGPNFPWETTVNDLYYETSTDDGEAFFYFADSNGTIIRYEAFACADIEDIRAMIVPEKVWKEGPVSYDPEYTPADVPDGLMSENYADCEDLSFCINGTKFTIGECTFQDLIDAGFPAGPEDADVQTIRPYSVTNVRVPYDRTVDPGFYEIDYIGGTNAIDNYDNVVLFNTTDTEIPVTEGLVIGIIMSVHYGSSEPNVYGLSIPCDTTIDELKENAGDPTSYGYYSTSLGNTQDVLIYHSYDPVYEIDFDNNSVDVIGYSYVKDDLGFGYAVPDATGYIFTFNNGLLTHVQISTDYALLLDDPMDVWAPYTP